MKDDDPLSLQILSVIHPYRQPYPRSTRPQKSADRFHIGRRQRLIVLTVSFFAEYIERNRTVSTRFAKAIVCRTLEQQDTCVTVL